MGTRRKHRELALQALYDMDANQDISEARFQRFNTSFLTREPPPEFYIQLVKGVTQTILEIDQLIREHSSNWKISRMPIVDRNIMRIAVYEIMYCHDIPAKVSINEAIDIGKKFGADDSGAFINGILDSICTNLLPAEHHENNPEPGDS